MYSMLCHPSAILHLISASSDTVKSVKSEGRKMKQC